MSHLSARERTDKHPRADATRDGARGRVSAHARTDKPRGKLAKTFADVTTRIGECPRALWQRGVSEGAMARLAFAALTTLAIVLALAPASALQTPASPNGADYVVGFHHAPAARWAVAHGLAEVRSIHGAVPALVVHASALAPLLAAKLDPNVAFIEPNQRLHADGTGWDGAGGEGTGWDGTGWDGRGGDGTGWDGTGWDGTGWDATGWDAPAPDPGYSQQWGLAAIHAPEAWNVTHGLRAVT